MAKSLSIHPTKLELMILQILWRRGPATVREVRDALDDQRDRAYTSVMTTMNSMWEKGYLKRDMQDGKYIYRPRISEKATARRMLSDVVDRVFNGSRMAAMMHLLETSNIDADALKCLSQEIRRKAKEQSS